MQNRLHIFLILFVTILYVPEKKILFAEILFLISMFIIADKLLINQVQITLDNGQTYSVIGSAFTYYDAILFIFFSFVAGICFDVLFFSKNKTNPLEKTPELPEMVHSKIEKLLSKDEKDIYLKIKENNNEILQKDLVAESSFSSVKISRILTRLENKGIIDRYKHGMTNRIVIKN